MALNRPSVLVAKWAPQYGFASVCVPRGVSVTSCLSWGAPQHQQNSLINLLSNCCLCSGTQRMCDFATPFKSESHTPPVLLYANPTDLQRQTSWELMFPMQDPCVEEPDVRPRPLPPWKEPLQLWLSSCLWVTSLGVWVLAAPHLCLTVVSSLYL